MGELDFHLKFPFLCPPDPHSKRQLDRVSRFFTVHDRPTERNRNSVGTSRALTTRPNDDNDDDHGLHGVTLQCCVNCTQLYTLL